MNPTDFVLTNLPVILCVAVTVASVAWLTASLVRAHRRKAVDTSGWAPARGRIADRRDYERRGRALVQLTVDFSTWDGQPVRFVDELSAWDVEYGQTVPVIYNPEDPRQARVIRRVRGSGRH